MTRWNSLLKPCLKNISSGMNLGSFVPMVHINFLVCRLPQFCLIFHEILAIIGDHMISTPENDSHLDLRIFLGSGNLSF